MKKLVKKPTFFLVLLLLTAKHLLYAAESINQFPVQLQKDHTVALTREKRGLLANGYCRRYNIPQEICFLVIYFVRDNPLQYRKKSLPSDLSGENLSGYDFTGCQFTYTNLTGTCLDNTILVDTTCNYLEEFKKNINRNNCQEGEWYKSNLPNDLKSITKVYPKLKNDADKVKLLHIACGISRLPFYEHIELYIRVYYWSSLLLQLKRALSNRYGKELVCSLRENLEDDVNNDCWETKYPQDKVSIDAKTSHANFVVFLRHFKENRQYILKKKAKGFWTLLEAYYWYENSIIEGIKGLKKAYPHIKKTHLKKEACDIAYALSRSYQLQNRAFQHHYIVCQHRLLRLKESVKNEKGKSNIYYSGRLYREKGWHKIST